jgi:hypothetical protein
MVLFLPLYAPVTQGINTASPFAKCAGIFLSVLSGMYVRDKSARRQRKNKLTGTVLSTCAFTPAGVTAQSVASPFIASIDCANRITPAYEGVAACLILSNASVGVATSDKLADFKRALLFAVEDIVLWTIVLTVSVDTCCTV